MLFKSAHPDIDIPDNIPLWDWLFSSNRAAFSSNDAHATKGFTNAESNERLTLGEVKQSSTWLSTALIKDHDFKYGDVVSVCSPNSVLYPVCTYGVMRAGGIPALSSPGYTEDEMEHILRTVDCRFIMVSVAALEVALKAASRLGISKSRIFTLDGRAEGHKTVIDLLRRGQQLRESQQVTAATLPPGKKNSEVCAVLCFSSGTTGLPKAVMVSHQNIIAQCLQLLQTTSDDHKTILGLLPFYHITGVVKMLVFAFVIDAEVVIVPKFTLKGLLDAITKYQIAEVQMVPPLLIRLVREPLVEKYDLSCIKRFASGAAPSSAEVLQLLEQRFPGRGFKQGYGMTESTGCITTHPLDKHSFRYARTGGSIVANTLVKIVDGDGKQVGVGEKGEILAKGPQIVIGYLNNQKATDESFDEDGFLRTGDEGSIDEEGMITIHDRLKEMIKVKGIQVAPAELEDLLLGHEKVEDVAVIGVPDDYAGELPFAYIVLKPQVYNAKEVRDEIIRYVQEKKNRNKWLGGIKIIDVVPKSASGKILRRVLRKDFKADWVQPTPKL